MFTKANESFCYNITKKGWRRIFLSFLTLMKMGNLSWAIQAKSESLARTEGIVGSAGGGLATWAEFSSPA